MYGWHAQIFGQILSRFLAGLLALDQIFVGGDKKFSFTVPLGRRNTVCSSTGAEKYSLQLVQPQGGSPPPARHLLQSQSSFVVSIVFCRLDHLCRCFGCLFGRCCIGLGAS